MRLPRPATVTTLRKISLVSGALPFLTHDTPKAKKKVNYPARSVGVRYRPELSGATVRLRLETRAWEKKTTRPPIAWRRSKRGLEKRRRAWRLTVLYARMSPTCNDTTTDRSYPVSLSSRGSLGHVVFRGSQPGSSPSVWKPNSTGWLLTSALEWWSLGRVFDCELIDALMMAPREGG
ncbi:hypothetical protein BC826DRAFT_83587 [Russula brevipes]|nr:hypothetical protein BC826DRAFT_83587 [Russula brevipes]